ncbi:hypothetical protein BJV74DRAFT_880994 [Russula compacta]|nr:hypothetical protein BJV74DRAFT_880994 [Russula compacta]
MPDDNCSDCGLAHHLHIREDGIYGCPGGSSISGSLCGHCREPVSFHADPNSATITCPGRYVSTFQDASSEYADSSMRSESPDPLLLVPDNQLPQRHYPALWRSTQPEGVAIPLRRSSRLEGRRRPREDAEPYAQARARRSSRRVSLQDTPPSYGHWHDNEAAYPVQDPLPRRKSLQPYVLNRMFPVEDMDPIEGFRPFTELDPGQLPNPVTIREPMRDLAKPSFEYVWNPTVVVPAVGGMRVRVGQFERRGPPAPAGDITPFACSTTTADENETTSSSSGSEDYFTAQDWSSSSTPEHHPSDHGRPSCETFPQTMASPPPSHPSPPQPEFIQGSSKSIPPLQQQTLGSGFREAYLQSVENEFPHFDALARHYAVVQNREKGIDPLQQRTSSAPRHATEPTPSAPALASYSFRHPESHGAPLQDPFTHTHTHTAPQPFQIEQPHSPPAEPRRRSTMPGTLPGATLAAEYRSGSTPKVPDRGATELAVDEVEDWAAREPWEYVHRVLTSSTRALVMFLKTPTCDIPAAALGALGAHLHLQKMLIDNEHWLLIGPRDVNLYEFGVKFQTRARTPDKFVFRFGNLNWGADVNQIEDEVCKAAMECSARRGRGSGGMPAALPAQFMAGAMGGFVVWYALSLM